MDWNGIRMVQHSPHWSVCTALRRGYVQRLSNHDHNTYTTGPGAAWVSSTGLYDTRGSVGMVEGPWRVAFTVRSNYVFLFRKRSVGSVHADRRCQRLLALSHGLSGPWRCSAIAAASHTVAIDASSTISMTCRCSALTRRRGKTCVLIPEPTGHIHLKGESSRHSLVCGECRVHPFFSCIRSGRCRSVIKVFTPPRRVLNAGRNAMPMVGGRREHWALWACPNAHHRCRSRRGPSSHQRPRTSACRARMYHNFRIVTELRFSVATRPLMCNEVVSAEMRESELNVKMSNDESTCKKK